MEDLWWDGLAFPTRPYLSFFCGRHQNYLRTQAKSGKVPFFTPDTVACSTGVFTTTDADIVHDDLSGFVADEHVAHTGVTITAGDGLTGGGDISATRTLNVGAGLGISVAANEVTLDSATIGSFGTPILEAIKARDGASSGLDADTLDGQEGAFYRIDVYDASGTLLN